MASKKKSDPNPCKCLVGVNKALEAKGVAVSTGMNLTSGRIWPLVAVESLTTQRPKYVPLTANFCPFCGVDLRVAS